MLRISKSTPLLYTTISHSFIRINIYVRSIISITRTLKRLYANISKKFIAHILKHHMHLKKLNIIYSALITYWSNNLAAQAFLCLTKCLNSLLGQWSIGHGIRCPPAASTHSTATRLRFPSMRVGCFPQHDSARHGRARTWRTRQGQRGAVAAHAAEPRRARPNESLRVAAAAVRGRPGSGGAAPAVKTKASVSLAGQPFRACAGAGRSGQ